MSSRTRIEGRSASRPPSATATSLGTAPGSRAASSAPSAMAATSTNGPSGRGVNRTSHVPHRTPPGGSACSQNCRRSDVFPIPASPVTSASRPRPVAATSAKTLESVVSWSERSSSPARSTMDPVVPAMARHYRPAAPAAKDGYRVAHDLGRSPDAPLTPALVRSRRPIPTPDPEGRDASIHRSPQLSRRASHPGRQRWRGGLPGGHRPQRRRRRDLDQLLRERGQAHDLLRLRRPQSGGDPQDRPAQRPAGRPDHAGPRARSIPLRVKEHGMPRKSAGLTASLALLAVALAVPAAQAKGQHSYTSTIQSTAISTGSGYPAPGGTAVLAGTWSSKLFGAGSVVDRVKITGQPDATTFAFKGTEVCFGLAGTIRDTFTGTAAVLPDGSQKLSIKGTFTGGTGAYKGAKGSYTFTGATAPGSLVVNGHSAGTLTY